MRFTDPYAGAPYVPVQSTRPRRRVWPFVLVALALVVICGGAIGLAAAMGGDKTPPAGVQVTDPGMGNTGPGDKSAPKTTIPASSITDGTWAVNEEVRPGTYTAVVPDDLFDLCAWFIRTGPNPEDIRDYGTGNAGDRMRVTIKKSDHEFEAQGCGPWTRAK